MMCGCRVGGMGDTPRLGYWVIIMLILFLMVAMGCATPVKQECPVAPKCPPSFIEAYNEAEDAADRLEDALSEALAEGDACQQAFNRYQRKSR